MTETEPQDPDAPAAATTPASDPALERRNYSFLVGDVSTYFIGMGFIDSATALPALVGRLGGNDIWLGVLLALKQAGWYLPQPLSAHLLRNKTEYLGYLRVVTLCGRIGFFPAALCVLLLGGSQPTVALGAFALAYALCWFGDGAGGVPWTAFIGRAIPASRRGGLFASTQFISGFSRLAVGAVVAWLLAGDAVRFPGNLALLVLACGFWVMVSWGCLAALREPPVAPDERRAPLRVESFAAYLRSFPAKFRERPYLMRLAAVQILAQTAGASVPFLLPADAAKSGLPGILLAVQTVGLMAFAPVWGTITDRRGPRQSLTGHFLVGLLLCAAAVASLAATGPLSLPLLLAAYFLFGGVMDAWATATNYQLESLPEEERATYIGLMNAATAPTLLLPLLAGLVAGTLGKLPLFVLAAALILTGFLLARTLPDTRKTGGAGMRHPQNGV